LLVKPIGDGLSLKREVGFKESPFAFTTFSDNPMCSGFLPFFAEFVCHAGYKYTQGHKCCNNYVEKRMLFFQHDRMTVNEGNSAPIFGEPIKGKKHKYGFNWRLQTHDLAIELAMFREKITRRIPSNVGGVEIADHFKTIAKALWPENDKKAGANFIWHPWADRMLDAACKYDYLAIAGSGGFGKSEMYAIWAIVNYLADPENTIVLATSTTIKASKQRIWGKIVKYWQICEQLGLPGKLIDSLNTIRYVDGAGKAIKGDLAGITLIPGEKKKEKDATGKMQGIHQKNVIFVADELSELSEAITEVAFYNLSKGCERFQFIGISNPASYVDAFGKFAKPKEGWETISVEDDEWETERGICLHFDTLKNPNMMRGKKVYPWMDGPEDLEKVPASERNTASYWRMYRGFWCPAGVSDQIYSEVEIVNARATDKAIWLDNELVRVAFLDPSFTNGGDRAILYFGTVGKLAEPYGYKGLQYDEFLKFAEDVTDESATRTEQIVRWFRDECVKRGVQPRHAGYDKSGAGAPLGDVISIAWSKDVYGLQFGGKASDKPVSAYDQTPAYERYVNSVSEIWYSLKEFMRAGQIKGISNDFMQEMCHRKLDKGGVKDLNLRIKVMPKIEMKLRYGMSPDIADAGMGLLALCRERLSLDSSTATKALNPNNKSESKGWKNAFSKFRSVYA
jgi:hypothetical protein